MLPRINVVLPDGPEPRRSLTTGTAWSELRGTGGDEDEVEEVMLHEPTTQEMLQYELMRMRLDPQYEPKHPKAWLTREFVLLVVARNGKKLAHMWDKFKNDKEFVMAAAKQYDGEALGYASEALKNDKEFIIAIVKQNGLALAHVPNAFKDDKEVVMAAVKQNGLALADVPNAFKDDKEVVMAAVKQEGEAVVFSNLKNDKEVVMAALKQRPLMYKYVSSALKNDPDVQRAAGRAGASFL